MCEPLLTVSGLQCKAKYVRYNSFHNPVLRMGSLTGLQSTHLCTPFATANTVNQSEEYNYHNWTMSMVLSFLFKSSTFRILDAVSIFRWNPIDDVVGVRRQKLAISIGPI
jgi:hypothetical protein